MSTLGDCCHTLSESTDYIRNRSNRGDAVWNSNVLHKKLERELGLLWRHQRAVCPWTTLLARTVRMARTHRRACPASLLVLHHLFIGRWGRVAVGRRGWVGCASVRWTGLDLESHCHGIANRIHPGSSRVSVIWRPHLLGSWKTDIHMWVQKRKSHHLVHPCATRSLLSPLFTILLSIRNQILLETVTT